MPQFCIVYTNICLAIEEKSRKTISQVLRMALGCPAQNAIRLVDLAIVGLSPRLACRTLPFLSFASTFGLLRYLPSFRTWGFPMSAKFESKLAVTAPKW